MLNFYSLFDKKMGEFSPPTVAVNDVVIYRSLRDGLSPESLPGKHPEDFDLYFLGTFDPATGSLSSSGPSKFVCNLSLIMSDSPGGL